MKHREWRGSEYKSSRLLVLGESPYSWQENGEWIRPREDHNEESVRWIVSDDGWNGDRTGARFFFQVTRALAGMAEPGEEQRRRAWEACVFTNYVIPTVGRGSGERPSRKMLRDARAPFLELLAALDPSPYRILVLGKGMWSEMPECQVYRTDDVQAYRLADGSLAWAKAMTHPCARSAYSWAVYAKEFAKFRAAKLPKR